MSNTAADLTLVSLATDTGLYQSLAQVPLAQLNTSNVQFSEPGQVINSPFFYRSPNGIMSPEQAADIAAENKRVQQYRAAQAIEEGQRQSRQSLADKIQADQEYAKYLADTPEGATPNPFWFKSSNGVVPSQQLRDMQILSQQADQVKAQQSIDNAKQNYAQSQQQRAQASKDYADFKNQQSGANAQFEPTSTGGDNTSIATDGTPQEIPKSIDAPQTIVDPPVLNETPTTGNQLYKSLTNNTGTSRLTQEPTFSNSRPGLQTEPAGEAQLTAPAINNSSPTPATGLGNALNKSIGTGAITIGASSLLAAGVAAATGGNPLQAATSTLAGGLTGSLTTGAILAAATGVGITGGLATIPIALLALGAGALSGAGAANLVGSLFNPSGQPQPNINGSQSTIVDAPFTGGQCYASKYKVTVKWTIDYTEYFKSIHYDANPIGHNETTAELYGPISIRPDKESYGGKGEPNGFHVYSYSGPNNSLIPQNQEPQKALTVNYPPEYGPMKITAFSVEPLSNYPDNCGNPTSIPNFSPFTALLT